MHEHPRTPSMLVIDADAIARASVRQAAQQLDWLVLEAADSLTGIELFRRYEGEITLVVLDVELPDLDGYDTCLRLRAISRHRHTPLPILPFAMAVEGEPFLSALGCAPTLLKPATVEEIGQALRNAIRHAVQPSLPAAFLGYAYRKANATEQVVRQHRGNPPRIIVFGSSQIVRTGIAHLLRSIGALVVAETNSVPALRSAVAYGVHRVLVTDAEGSAQASEIAYEHGVPLLVLAVSGQQRHMLLHDESLLVQADAVVDISTDHALRVLPEALVAIQGGKQFVRLDTARGNAVQSAPTVPAHVLAQLANTKLSRRWLELLWLDYQGWSTGDIARHLTLTEATVQSYWKRIQRTTHQTRGEVRAWFRRKMQAM